MVELERCDDVDSFVNDRDFVRVVCSRLKKADELLKDSVSVSNGL